MNKINLVDGLLSHGRRLHEAGQLSRAAGILKRLVAFQELPAATAEEAQSLLADIQFRQGRFTRARRHLRAALAHSPTSADYHHRLALALEEDPEANPSHAINHFRRCIKLDPRNPHYWCDYAYACINAEEMEKGLKALRKAHRLAPDDAEVLSIIVHALRNEGHEGEAKQMLRSALFRNPKDSRFRNLWDRFQFDLLFDRQQKDVPPVPEEKKRKAVILKFNQPRKPDIKIAGRTFRHDGPATIKGPSFGSRKGSSKKSS